MKRRRHTSQKSRKPNAGMVPGIGWYSHDQYARLREVSDDRDGMYDTWLEWEANASNTLKQLRADGVPARKVPVDVEEMIAWCAARGQSVTGSSRAAYIAEVLRTMPPESV